MIKHQKSIVLTFRVTMDIFMLTFAWLLSYFMRFHTVFPAPKGIPSFALYSKLIPFIIVIWVLIMISVGLYQRTGKHRSAIYEALDIIQACFFASLGFIAFTHFYEEYSYSRGVLLTYTLMHPIFLITGRSLVRKSIRLYSRNSAKRYVLLIAGGDLIEHSVEIGKYSNLGHNTIQGCILVGNDEDKAQARAYCETHDIPTIELPEATSEGWIQLFLKYPCQTVIIAIPAAQYTFFDRHLAEIVPQVPDVRLIPDIVRYTRFAANLEVVKGTPVINIHDSPLNGIGRIFKRILDFSGALFGLIVLAPLLGLLALLVRMSSPGPILYRQERMGLDGQIFHILKFRSMPTDSESKTGAVFAQKGDDRSTVIGKIMRQTSLDELPQLINVLKGEMSLVGPRPERPVFVNQFRSKVPDYMLRHKVKAGMTGWAQISGWRGDTSIEKRIECDLFYIQNWSFWLDIKIILLTFIKGFINKNAY